MDNVDYKKLGERIKEERLGRKLTQAKLAEALNISTAYVGQIERGERCPTLDTLVVIANNLDVTVDYLLRDSLRAYRVEDQEEWGRLIDGKTSEEKQTIIDIVKSIMKYKTSK